MKFNYTHTIYSKRGDRLGLIGKYGASAGSIKDAFQQVLDAEQQLRTGPMFRDFPVTIETKMDWRQE